MTSAGHHSMMAKAGGAEPQPVEYLESDGNQWFDIALPRGSNTGAYIDYMLTESQVQKGIFGSGTVNSLYKYDLKFMIVGSGLQRFDRYDRSTRTFSLYVGQRQNFTFNTKGNASSSPYRYYSSLAGFIRQDQTWYSSSYTADDAVIGVFHAYNRSDILPVKMRLYGMELREYTSATAYATTLKLTPVQVGGVGAFLDEISGTLHFNQGTGAFILPS